MPTNAKKRGQQGVASPRRSLNRKPAQFSISGLASPTYFRAAAMFRSLLSLALSVLVLSSVQAQSDPAASPRKAAAQASRAAKKTQRAGRKAARSVARKPAAKPTVISTVDGWPPLDSTSVVASATPSDATYGAGPSASPYGRDHVYAGPGMPVNIRTSKVAVPYSVRPPRKSAQLAGTTLRNGQ